MRKTTTGPDTYDYIIVGAGAAGATLAEQLSARSDRSVLVLESGGRGIWNPLIPIPKASFFLMGSKWDSSYYPTNFDNGSGTVDYWQRGRVDGGSTAINGMQYDRAGAHYWNSVAAMADETWAWPRVLDVFRAIEDNELGPAESRGSGGPLSISVQRAPDELLDRIAAAAKAYGLPWTEELNAHDGERIGYIPNTIRRGRRVSTARAFLSRALKRKNVTRINNAHALRVYFDGARAEAVEALVDGNRRMFHAKAEIILSGGPIETPMLLERSGIGNPRVLNELGVNTVVEQPHVGEHAVEQLFFGYQWKINQNIGYYNQVGTLPRQALAGLKYLATGRGTIGTGAYDLGGFAKSNKALDHPDLFLMFAPFGLDLTATGMAPSREPAVWGTGYLAHPTSESSVHATSNNPFAPPAIDVHYLEDDWEQEAQKRIMEVAREIAAQSPLREIIVEEQMPGPDVKTREEVRSFSMQSGNAFHAVGTARMGVSEDSVVDPALRVKGVESLRVADASVLPRQPGNTMAPAILVGAMAARILADEI